MSMFNRLVPARALTTMADYQERSAIVSTYNTVTTNLTKHDHTQL